MRSLDDWLTRLSVSVVIGQIDYFGFKNRSNIQEEVFISFLHAKLNYLVVTEYNCYVFLQNTSRLGIYCTNLQP